MMKALKKTFITGMAAMCAFTACTASGLAENVGESELTKICLEPGMRVSGSQAYKNKNVINDPAYKAFDGDTNTIFDGLEGGYCIIDLGKEYSIDRIKYYPRSGAAYCQERMKGGIFYGSNNGNDWTALHTVADIPSTSGVVVNSSEYTNSAGTSWRYIKFQQDSTEEGRMANIAEIELYTSSDYTPAAKINTADMTITGGTSWNNSTPASNAFDGSITTYFDGLEGSYVQIDLGNKYSLNGIMCLSRIGHDARMKGGKFEVSEDGEVWNEVVSISETAGENNFHYSFELSGENVKKVKYVKYSNTSFANIAEIMLYGTEYVEPTPDPDPEPTPVITKAEAAKFSGTGEGFTVEDGKLKIGEKLFYGYKASLTNNGSTVAGATVKAKNTETNDEKEQTISWGAITGSDVDFYIVSSAPIEADVTWNVSVAE